MIQRFGIDTSILIRLATGDPEELFQRCVKTLRGLIEDQDAEIFASNPVISEAYVALQHHYGVSKSDSRAGLATVLKSGLVSPLGGRSVFEALEAKHGGGLLDRLIDDDYARADLQTLTLDRKVAMLPNAKELF